MANDDEKSSPPLPPRLTIQRPSMTTSQSWPRLPAFALTSPGEHITFSFDEEEEDQLRSRRASRHPLSQRDDDQSSTDSINGCSSSYSNSGHTTPEVRTADVSESESEDEDEEEEENSNNNRHNDEPTKEAYDEKDIRRRPSTVQHNSADTLVEAAMDQSEARDRHVRFQDHVAASAALVQQMLRQTNADDALTSPTDAARRQSQSQRNIESLHRATSTSTSSHQRRRDTLDSLEDSVHSPTETSGSVLASLMKLDAQRRRRHEEYLMKQAKTTKKKEKKRHKQQERASAKEKKKIKTKKRPASMLDLTALDEKLLTASYIEDDDKQGAKPTRPKMNRPVSWLSTMSTGQHVVPKLDKRKKSNMAMSRRSSMDSMITTASQFEPITLEDRVRITFEIANILQKQDFLKKLAKSLMLYGCPAHRLEYAMRQVSTTLGVDAEYIYMPNVMLMSFFDVTTHTTETHFIRQIQTFDMDKLSEIYRLEKLVSHGEVSVDEALEFIDQVSNKPPLYPLWLNPWVYALCSFAGCVMFFGGRWKEGGVAAALAMVFAGYEVISGRIQSFQPIWEITVCIVIGIVSQGLIKYDFCFTPVAFSAFIVVLPGYGMAIAIQELVSRQLVSGVVRMVYAIIYSFLLGYGVSMGSALYMTIDSTKYPSSQHCIEATSSTLPMASQSQWYNFLTVPLFALGYCLFVRAKPHRWPTMTFVAACGFVVNYSLNVWAHAPSQVLQVAPSFVLGLLGHLLTKFTGKMSFDAVLLGIFYLLPSSLGVKAALGLFGNTTSEVGTQGAGFALAMIESSIGITVGLFLATLIVYPRGTQHTPLMTF